MLNFDVANVNLVGNPPQFLAPWEGHHCCSTYSDCCRRRNCAESTRTDSVLQRFQSRLAECLHPGTQLDVLSVGGSFGCAFPEPVFQETAGKLLMLAAGIGVTPFAAMLRGLAVGESRACMAGCLHVRLECWGFWGFRDP